MEAENDKTGSLFKIGDLIEFRRQSAGYCGAWHKGKVLSISIEKKLTRYSISYLEKQKEHREWISINEDDPRSFDLLRPRPPRDTTVFNEHKQSTLNVMNKGKYDVGDKVDAFINGCWWPGYVKSKTDSKSITFVKSPPSEGDGGEVTISTRKIRWSLSWNGKSWNILKKNQKRILKDHQKNNIAQLPDQDQELSMGTTEAQEMQYLKNLTPIKKKERHVGYDPYIAGHSRAIKELARKSVENILTEYPSFVKAVPKAALTTRSDGMLFPLPFISQFFREECGEISVLDHEGKEWKMECDYIDEIIKNDTRQMSRKMGLKPSSWIEFASHHQIKEGDVVLFEVVSSNRMRITPLTRENQEKLQRLSFNSSPKEQHIRRKKKRKYSRLANKKLKPVQKRDNSLLEPLNSELQVTATPDATIPMDSKTQVPNKSNKNQAQTSVNEVSELKTVSSSKKSKTKRMKVGKENTEPKELCDTFCENGIRYYKPYVTLGRNSQEVGMVTLKYIENIRTRHPSFAKLLRHSDLRAPDTGLGLPMPFVSSYMSRSNSKIVLEDEKGLLWNMEWIFCTYTGSNPRIKMGWMAFVNHYGLCKGQVLLLELVEKSKFKVALLEDSSLTTKNERIELDSVLEKGELEEYDSEEKRGENQELVNDRKVVQEEENPTDLNNSVESFSLSKADKCEFLSPSPFDFSCELHNGCSNDKGIGNDDSCEAMKIDSENTESGVEYKEEKDSSKETGRVECEKKDNKEKKVESEEVGTKGKIEEVDEEGTGKNTPTVDTVRKHELNRKDVLLKSDDCEDTQLDVLQNYNIDTEGNIKESYTDIEKSNSNSRSTAICDKNIQDFRNGNQLGSSQNSMLNSGNSKDHNLKPLLENKLNNQESKRTNECSPTLQSSLKSSQSPSVFNHTTDNGKKLIDTSSDICSFFHPASYAFSHKVLNKYQTKFHLRGKRNEAKKRKRKNDKIMNEHRDKKLQVYSPYFNQKLPIDDFAKLNEIIGPIRTVYPSFIKYFTKASVLNSHNGLHLPSSFMTKYIKSEKGIIILENDLLSRFAVAWEKCEKIPKMEEKKVENELMNGRGNKPVCDNSGTKGKIQFSGDLRVKDSIDGNRKQTECETVHFDANIQEQKETGKHGFRNNGINTPENGELKCMVRTEMEKIADKEANKIPIVTKTTKSVRRNRHKKKYSFWFRQGWTEFFNFMQIKEGMALIFELISSNVMRARVIWKKNHVAELDDYDDDNSMNTFSEKTEYSSMVNIHASNVTQLRTNESIKCKSKGNEACTQSCIHGYDFCINHILDDELSPYIQCYYIHPLTLQQCFSPVYIYTTPPYMCTMHKTPDISGNYPSNDRLNENFFLPSASSSMAHSNSKKFLPDHIDSMKVGGGDLSIEKKHKKCQNSKKTLICKFHDRNGDNENEERLLNKNSGQYIRDMNFKNFSDSIEQDTKNGSGQKNVQPAAVVPNAEQNRSVIIEMNLRREKGETEMQNDNDMDMKNVNRNDTAMGEYKGSKEVEIHSEINMGNVTGDELNVFNNHCRIDVHGDKNDNCNNVCRESSSSMGIDSIANVLTDETSMPRISNIPDSTLQNSALALKPRVETDAFDNVQTLVNANLIDERTLSSNLNSSINLDSNPAKEEGMCLDHHNASSVMSQLVKSDSESTI